MSEQMDATKDSTGELTPPNSMQSMAKYLEKEHCTIQKATRFWVWTTQN